MPISTIRLYKENLTFVGLNALKSILTNERYEEVERTVPAIKYFGAKYIRPFEVEEIDSLSGLDEKISNYDLFDIYQRSSNTILATMTTLSKVDKSITDLPNDVQTILNDPHIENDDEKKKIVRKAVIELVVKTSMSFNNET